ncbi:MAG: DegT/DnrJ/EryC1/StrS family aminotransferase [Candidatus Pacebacteria bacterium]|nr:DegT/DnrJ/EryC1/StrS family aminotransferase [Candidatus Paceibacterota bacterium]
MFTIGQEEIDAVAEVINTRRLFRYGGETEGRAAACERRITEIFGCSESLIVTSGTGALICGLVGLGIGPGDEVIVPAYTWLASAGAVLSVGAIPVLADVDETLTLDPDDFERRIGPRTKVVIPVHMAGRPADMDRILAVAKARGVAVLEDSCQAVGGSYKGRRLATIGDAGALSFNVYKNITCGEGGALLTNNRQVFERALYHHDMGSSFRGHTLIEPEFLGNSYRMNEIQAAVLHVQLGRLDGIIARLRERRDWIRDAIQAADTPLTLSPSADIEGDCGLHVSFLFGTADTRIRFSERAAELGCTLSSPIDSGKHVYTNWTTLLERKVGVHPKINPFLWAENRNCRISELTPDCCPRTLDLLARTATVDSGFNRTREECETLAATLCRVAKELD